MKPIYVFILISVSILSWLGCSPKEVATYNFLVEESFLKDSFDVFMSSLRFQVDNNQLISRKESQNWIIPDKNSQIIIIPDSGSIAIGRQINIYNYGFFENLAGSAETPERYFKHIDKLGKDFRSWAGKPINLDSLFSTFDRSQTIFLTNKDLDEYNISLKPLNNKMLSDSLSRYSKGYTDRSENKLLIYLGKSIDNHPDPNYGMMAYQTMRQFYERLRNVYEASYSSSDKEQLVSYIVDSFEPGATIEIQNKGDKNSTIYKIDEFLDRIMSEKRYVYDDVDLFMRNFSFLLQERYNTGAELPGKLEGEASFDQYFTAYRQGKVVYDDIVKKSVILSKYEDTTGSKSSPSIVPKFLIKSISVVDVIE